MTDSINIALKSTFDATGAAAAKVSIGQIGDAATKTDRQLLSYARTVASAQKAQGDNAGAAQTLAAALGRVDNSSKEALATIGALNRTTNQGATLAQQFGSAFTTSLTGIVGPAALAAAAIQAIGGAVELAQAGARVQSIEQSFDSLAVSAGLSSDALLASLQKAAAGTITNAQLMQSANTGLLLSNGRIAGELPRLIEIARASAKATGQDVGFIFDSLVRGISRGSPLIIDNAGITLDAAGAFETYAKSIGKSADELTKAEQQQATLNAVVAAGDEIITKTGGAVDNNAQVFARFGTLMGNIKDSIGGFAAVVGVGLIQPILNFTDALGRVPEQAASMNAALAANYGVVEQVATGTLRAADADDRAAASSANLSSTLGKGTQDKIDNQIATAALNEEQRSLERDSALAAQGLLGAGDQALILAQKYGIATEAAAFLIRQQQQLTNATALADQRKGEQTGTDLSAQEYDNFSRLRRRREQEDAESARREAEKRAREAAQLQAAQDAQRLARARTSAERIAELERQKNAATDPVERTRLETQIIQERNSQAKAHTSELNKQRQTHEAIYDSLNKQRNAQIALLKLTGENTLKTLEEDEQIKQANAVLNSPNASEDLKKRARARLQIIEADRAARAQQASELTATAGGTVQNGKLYQSIPGGAAPVTGAGVPVAAPAVAVSSGGAVTVINQLVIDGKVAAEAIEPYIWAKLIAGIQAKSAQVGL